MLLWLFVFELFDSLQPAVCYCYAMAMCACVFVFLLVYCASAYALTVALGESGKMTGRLVAILN